MVIAWDKEHGVNKLMPEEKLIEGRHEIVERLPEALAEADDSESGLNGGIDLESMTVRELEAFVENEGLDVDISAGRKEEKVSLIRSALVAQEFTLDEAAESPQED